MNTTTRIQCPTCGRNIAVRANGTLYTHGPAIARCPGRTEAADVDENPKRGYVECQDDDTHAWHSAEYSHQSQWGDKAMYAVVCSGYIEYYDATMLHDEPTGPVTDALI